MDPSANLSEQIEIAEEVVALADLDETDTQRLMELAERLAELVLALDGWRRRGGFDPYAG